MAAIALKKVTFGSDPKHQHIFELLTTAFDPVKVKAIIEAGGMQGVDIPTLIIDIIKDGPIAFEMAYSFAKLILTGTATVAQVEAMVIADYPQAYAIAQDIALLFGVTLPPLPISPGPAKP